MGWSWDSSSKFEFARPHPWSVSGIWAIKWANCWDHRLLFLSYGANTALKLLSWSDFTSSDSGTTLKTLYRNRISSVRRSGFTQRAGKPSEQSISKPVQVFILEAGEVYSPQLRERHKAVIYIGRPGATYRRVRAWSDEADDYSDVVICSSCIELVASKAGLDQQGFRKVEDLRQGFFRLHSSTVTSISSVKDAFRREKLWPQTLSRIRELWSHSNTDQAKLIYMLSFAWI